MGLGGSSSGSEARASSVAVFPEDWDVEDATERERAGVSKKGSLGARARLACTGAVADRGCRVLGDVGERGFD